MGEFLGPLWDQASPAFTFADKYRHPLQGGDQIVVYPCRAMASGDGAAPVKILLCCVSAVAAESATFPIDAVKTRLQLYASTAAAPPSAFRAAAEMLAKENGGVVGMYRGLPPAVLRHLIYTPLRIVVYENLRATGPGDSLLGRAVAGGISGVLAQVAASPADLVKVRMQADGGGQRGRYAGVGDAVRKIVRTEGVRGLWRGVVPNAQRAFLVNMGELACYDQAKRFVIRRRVCGDGAAAHILASLASGLSAAALSCPADVIKTRMMNQAGTYAGSWDCLQKTVRAEGLGALWKGFFPAWARLGPWQLVFWVSYERLRRAAGLSSF